jgi:hypothetical protein
MEVGCSAKEIKKEKMETVSCEVRTACSKGEIVPVLN